MRVFPRISVCTVLAVVCGCGLSVSHLLAADGKVSKYARFQTGTTVAYGVIEGDKITQIEGDLFGTWKKTAQSRMALPLL